jgi:OmpA family
MYIRAYTAFGDPLPAPARTDWRRWMMPDPPPQPLLVFRRIGPFAVNKSVLTPQLKQQVTQVVEFVRSRSNTAQAIGVIKIVGHTDASGTELHNTGLGNRRMEAVRAELHAQLGDLSRRVAIDVEESPGKSKPIGDNRTAKGQAANRRVDVYVGPTIPKAEPWTTPYKWTFKPPPDGPQDPYCWDCDLTKLGGKSVRQFLMDLCRRGVSRDKCKWMVDKAISGGCKGIELFLEQVGATISAEQKKELERQCGAAANKKI